MKRKWETFEGQQFRLEARRVPRVTLGRKGTFYLNGIAYKALGSPSAVEMLFDGNERIIGIKATDAGKRNAFLIKDHGKAGSYKRISAAAFCTHYRIKTRSTMLFNGVDLDDDGVMILELARTTFVSRGSK